MCGFFGDATRECRCTPAMIQRYLGKISGPLLDRIDIHVEVPTVPYKELREGPAVESSAEIRMRVQRARERQVARGYNNARMPSRMIRKHSALNEAGERTLEMAVRRLSGPELLDLMTKLATVAARNAGTMHILIPYSHSCRSATMGSMREALRAGTYPASSAAPSRIATASVSASGSLGFIP